jgi:hypothetical protein
VTTPTPPEFLRITEIHYHPAPPTTPAELQVSSDADEFEFIEFQNIGVEPLDIGGVRFISGITFAFPSGTTVPGGGYIVAVRNLAAFAARYGGGIPIAGEFPTSNLQNSGELLDLRDAPGNIIHQFTYGDGSWYPASDGGGYSLHIRDARATDLGSWGSALAWELSGNLHGNPGAPNTSSGPSFQSWQALHFTEAERNDPLISGAAIDLNDDGTPNLLKYAFGLDPREQNPPAAMPAIATPGGEFQFSFRRQINANDLEYLPQISGDLFDWETLTNQVGAAIDNGDGTETLTFKESDPPGTSTKKFGRLRVSLLQP